MFANICTCNNTHSCNLSQPGNQSCDSAHSSWSDSEARSRGYDTLRWQVAPSPSADTCEHATAAIRFRHYGQCNTSVFISDGAVYVIGYCVHCNGQVWDNVKVGKSYS